MGLVEAEAVRGLAPARHRLGGLEARLETGGAYPLCGASGAGVDKRTTSGATPPGETAGKQGTFRRPYAGLADRRVTWRCRLFQRCSSGERFLAVLHALRHLLHRVGARRNSVLQLDVGVDRPLLLLEELQDLLNRRLALTPGEVAAVGGAVLQVQADDLVVVLFDDRDRRLAPGAGDVVPDVEVEADIFSNPHQGVDVLDRRRVVR